MKSDLFQEHQIVNIKKKQGRGRKPSIKDIELPPLWPGGKALSAEKLKDLKELYKLVLKDAQAFQKTLLSSNTEKFEDDQWFWSLYRF